MKDNNFHLEYLIEFFLSNQKFIKCESSRMNIKWRSFSGDVMFNPISGCCSYKLRDNDGWEVLDDVH